MDTAELAVLVYAAAAGSISAAGRRMGVSAMVASRRLAGLEARLGVRLMHRTTRSVSLTPEGEAFLPFAQEMLEAEAAALATLATGDRGASGLLRVTTPAAFGRKVVAPMLPALLAKNPELRIELELSDRIAEMVGEGFDLAIRIGKLRDSTLIARKIAPNVRVLCASPVYLEREGKPRTVGDLAAHECLLLSGVTHWSFDVGGRTKDVRVSGRFSSSSVEAVHALCRGGHGLALLSTWDVGEELAAGSLLEVKLDGAFPQKLAIWAVYPTARLVPRKVQLFIAELAAAVR